MLKTIQDWWKRNARCLLKGHDLEPTGRDCFVLKEWRCRQCHRIFVSNIYYPGGLLPGDEASDSLFKSIDEVHAWMETDAAKQWLACQPEKPVAPMDPKA